MRVAATLWVPKGVAKHEGGDGALEKATPNAAALFERRGACKVLRNRRGRVCRHPADRRARLPVDASSQSKSATRNPTPHAPHHAKRPLRLCRIPSRSAAPRRGDRRVSCPQLARWMAGATEAVALVVDAGAFTPRAAPEPSQTPSTRHRLPSGTSPLSTQSPARDPVGDTHEDRHRLGGKRSRTPAVRPVGLAAEVDIFTLCAVRYRTRSSVRHTSRVDGERRMAFHALFLVGSLAAVPAGVADVREIPLPAIEQASCAEIDPRIGVERWTMQVRNVHTVPLVAFTIRLTDPQKPTVKRLSSGRSRDESTPCHSTRSTSIIPLSSCSVTAFFFTICMTTETFSGNDPQQRPNDGPAQEHARLTWPAKNALGLADHIGGRSRGQRCCRASSTTGVARSLSRGSGRAWMRYIQHGEPARHLRRNEEQLFSSKRC